MGSAATLPLSTLLVLPGAGISPIIRRVLKLYIMADKTKSANLNNEVLDNEMDDLIVHDTSNATSNTPRHIDNIPVEEGVRLRVSRFDAHINPSKDENKSGFRKVIFTTCGKKRELMEALVSVSDRENTSGLDENIGKEVFVNLQRITKGDLWTNSKTGTAGVFSRDSIKIKAVVPYFKSEEDVQELQLRTLTESGCNPAMASLVISWGK